jgi:hypothetical protein
MGEPDLKKYAQEVSAMQDLPPATIKLPPLAALAIISHIQLATRHPAIGDDAFTKIAIETARQLQQLFNPESETYKVLELGWNPTEDILPAEAFCDEPCEKFLQNLGCRCTGYKVAEIVAGDDESLPPELLAKAAAVMHQVTQSFEAEGLEVTKHLSKRDCMNDNKALERELASINVTVDLTGEEILSTVAMIQLAYSTNPALGVLGECGKLAAQKMQERLVPESLLAQHLKSGWVSKDDTIEPIYRNFYPPEGFKPEALNDL